MAVADHGGFSRAARQCFVSQSAVSHQIATLEKELGAELFERTGRRVRLTEAGEILLPRARDLLRLRDEAADAVRPRPDRIRLAANMSFARAALAAIETVRDRHAGAEIDFLIKPFAQRIAAVKSGEADLALIRGRLDEPGLYLEPLWVDNPLIAFSTRHPRDAREGTVGRGTGALPLLLPPAHEQVLLHRLAERVFAANGLEVRLGPEIREDHPVAFELVNHPDGWTLLYEDPRQPGIASRPAPGFTLPVSAVLRTDAVPNALVAELLVGLSNGYRR
ncbi:hypothetical protein MTP03_14080 [Tsukamurella sp. PLM1]|nr:hypothetical protein MTP03_14080 [Tsukamurella sp. PLM1]